MTHQDILIPSEMKEPLYRLVQNFQLERVGLVLGETDQCRQFALMAAGLLGGTFMETSSPHPCATLLESLDRFDYFSIFVDEPLSDDLFRMLRDYAIDRHGPLQTRYGKHSIHKDHRLALFFPLETYAALHPDHKAVLREFTSLSVLSNSPMSPTSHGELHRGYAVFDSIQGVIGWCDRFYPDGQFLFRGQSKDWNVRSSAERFNTEAEAEAARKRMLRFVEWVMTANGSEELAMEAAIATAQHFGIATPYLDLTRVSRVAAFFACSGNVEPGSLGVLYVYHGCELRKALDLGEELKGKIGNGLIEPSIEGLRRIKTQQGVFADSRGWLVEGFTVTRLYFHHTVGADFLPESVALPREFIYPPPSAFETKINAFLIADSLSGASEYPERSIPHLSPVSADWGGYRIRSYLDGSPSASDVKLPLPFSNLDLFAGLLSLSCSHLLACHILYQQFIVEFGAVIKEAENRPARLRQWFLGIRQLVSEVHALQSTDGPEALCIQDLVDGLAFFLAVRSQAEHFDFAGIGKLVGPDSQNLIRAYRVCDHWLGNSAPMLFPILGCFALNCVRPVSAFIDAIKEAGRHDASKIAGKLEHLKYQYLSLWTGHYTVTQEAILELLDSTCLLKARIDALKQARKEKLEQVDRLGPSLDRLNDAPLIRQLAPPVRRSAHGKIEVSSDLAEVGPAVVIQIEKLRSAAEGVAGFIREQACPHVSCSWHSLHLCSFVTQPQGNAEACTFRKSLHEMIPIDALSDIQKLKAGVPLSGAASN